MFTTSREDLKNIKVVLVHGVIFNPNLTWTFLMLAILQRKKIIKLFFLCTFMLQVSCKKRKNLSFMPKNNTFFFCLDTFEVQWKTEQVSCFDKQPTFHRSNVFTRSFFFHSIGFLLHLIGVYFKRDHFYLSRQSN